jgi:hypothetical protein
VDFYATSQRTALAYRSAARQNKCLARAAVIHELGSGTAAVEELARHREFAPVVLSHTDDVRPDLTDPRVRKAFSGAFHLLFTGAASHPDQVVQWVLSVGISRKGRLHVVKVDDLEAVQVSQLLARVCSALGPDGDRASIIDAYLSGDTLVVLGPAGRILRVPVSQVPALVDQPPEVLRNFEIDPDGSFVYWPGLDVHLGWEQFRQAAEPDELLKARQRSDAFNERYGAAIRRVRKAAGVSQSRVEGLTDRQLRRIEQGVCRATIAAIRALARAHGLDANTYMEKVAEAIL